MAKSNKRPHNAMGCKCPKCMSKRTKAKNRTPVNNEWQRFRDDAKSWHQQRRRDEKRYNDLCGEVTVIKPDGGDK